ncbi:MAG: hypothetical protein KGD57_05760 [Candidatus Lokiarchaeota archaeon]|nr:hypothetical protein [Candidatus Lokiarchaeota archaeon]
MNLNTKNIIYDSVKNIRTNGKFSGSIIVMCKNQNIILTDSLIFNDDIFEINKGLMVGFESILPNKKEAFSISSNFTFDLKDDLIDYSVLIPESLVEKFDKERFSDAFPYTINLLHSAGLLLNEDHLIINHLDFFKGEILKNPIALIHNGICIADRVVIDESGNPIFYGTLIIGRNKKEDISISYESIVNVADKLIKYIIIIGIEAIKE